MKRKRGRKALIEKNNFIEAIQEYKDDIVEDNQLVPRDHSVWGKLAKHVAYKWKPLTFFINVHANQDGVRDILLSEEEQLDADEFDKSELEFSDKDVSYDAMSIDDDAIPFQFVMTEVKIKELTEFTCLQQKRKGKQVNPRRWCLFKSGLYQEYLRGQIWAAARIRCGFAFKNSYMRMDMQQGNFTGKRSFNKPFEIVSYPAVDGKF